MSDHLKVFISGSGARGSNDLFFADAFRRAGARVSFFDDEKIYHKYLSYIPSSFLRKAFHYFFWFVCARFIQRLYIEAVLRERPNMLFIIKGFFLAPSTIIKIRTILPKTKIICFNPDNPFNTWHHFNSNVWIRKSIPLYDAYLIWGEFLFEALYAAGARQVFYLPFAFDPSSKHPLAVDTKEKTFFGSDVAFIGSWDEEREEILNQLVGYDVKIWGNSWEKASVVAREKWQHRDVIGDDFCRVCASAKIILNIVRKQNIPAHNMRTFEVPACGGFLLGTYTAEQDALFPEGVSMAYFRSIDDLKIKIDYYLAHNGERRIIAQTSLGVVSSHTFDARIRAILEIYHSLI